MLSPPSLLTNFTEHLRNSIKTISCVVYLTLTITYDVQSAFSLLYMEEYYQLFTRDALIRHWRIIGRPIIDA